MKSISISQKDNLSIFSSKDLLLQVRLWYNKIKLKR